MEETNAFLSPLLTSNFMLPSKGASPVINEGLLDLIRTMHGGSVGQLTQPQQQQKLPLSNLPVIQTSQSDDSNVDQPLKASPSASSETSSHDGDSSCKNISLHSSNPLQLTVDSASNIAASVPTNTEQKLGRNDTWLECFMTTKATEYEALLFSVYVTERSTPKVDGWTHFDCLHRLQSKCRYRLRTKKQDEFFIIEEKGVHNHGSVEPVGQAGSHAGLPKTIREIVDRSYNENWSLEARTVKVDEEIRRLGLPANPRLGRQIDNRVAYLRRVKNLSESRRIQDQMNNVTPSPEEMLQALMEQNGGRMVVDKGIVEQMIGPKAVAALAAAQQEMGNENEAEDLAQMSAASQELFHLLQQNQSDEVMKHSEANESNYQQENA